MLTTASGARPKTRLYFTSLVLEFTHASIKSYSEDNAINSQSYPVPQPTVVTTKVGHCQANNDVTNDPQNVTGAMSASNNPYNSKLSTDVTTNSSFIRTVVDTTTPADDSG